VLKTEIEETDLLFIDTLHTYKQLSQELTLHGNKARKYILIHDTNTWGSKDEVETDSEKKGELIAIEDFLTQNPHWKIVERIEESNGLMILERQPDFSVIIPTCRDEEIKNCLTSVFKYTNLKNKEIIVAANGCSSETMDFLISLRRSVKVISWPEKQGQIVPVNEAAKVARGEFIVFLDDDCILLEQPIDTWIEKLSVPFKSDRVGMSGVFVTDYPYLGLAVHNGCTMYSKKAWDEVNGMDPVYQFGYLCDADISFRMNKHQYSVEAVGRDGGFPIYHPGSPVTSEVKKSRVELIRINREILYTRHGKKPMYSVVVPTYNHCEDLLKPCLESIRAYTDFDTVDIEILVVANGCKDGTADYVDSLGFPFKLIWFDEGLGFTRAANQGIKAAKGDYIILFNNDALLLAQPKNQWLDMLAAPFLADEKVGITGPLSLFDQYAGYEVMIFFLAMLSRKLFNEIGLLDENFSPGGGEDIDMCVKAQLAGYKQVVVPTKDVAQVDGMNTGGFQVFHRGEGTFSNAEFPEYSKRIIKENGFKNMVKYNKHIKLNLGSGGVEIPGFLSIDKFDARANILMDIENLDLPDNSVEEIMALHIWEHLNPYHSMDNLRKWLRILKPGGKLIMEMPDVEQLCKRFVTANTGERYGILNAVHGSVNTTGVGGPDNITSPHLFSWFPDSIRDHLQNSGFVNITFGAEQFPHPESNMHVEAEKPL
jgi:GT2 family glycosyltransferase